MHRIELVFDKVVLRLVFGTILILSVLGCGGLSTGDFEIVRVTGIVTLDGRPLENAKVVFAPSSTKLSESPPYSSGVTDASGKYFLSLQNGTRGAVVGEHLVAIEVEGMDWERQYQIELQRRQVAAIKANRQISPQEEMDLLLEYKNKQPEGPTKFEGLKFSVAAGGTKEANFELASD